MLRSLVGSEMCIRDRYQRRVRGKTGNTITLRANSQRAESTMRAPAAHVLLVLLISAACCQTIRRLSARVLHTVELQSMAVSTVHSLLVSALAGHCCVHDTPFTQSTMGEACVSITIGFMLWDARDLWVYNIPPVAPLLAHHLLSSFLMAVMLGTAAESTYPVCILLLTEMTTPVLNFKAYLEAKSSTSTVLYFATRWVLVVGWVYFRFFILLRFGVFVWAWWDQMRLIQHVLGVVIGLFLLAFNVTAFFEVVVPGIPWWPPQSSKQD
eukprot:TRINITY_DN13960_c0_g1_i1.p1 TRINITY_DN13960_c0_g1~~TRINITY_DN13960_c0_g1_i1.p1  ORF type:complete len:268 (+),score=59.39 TRINITY_DN13960_c0_g1_i1:118-921(+)